MKYVIMNAASSSMGVDYAFPFIFSGKLVHSVAAEGFKAILDAHYNKEIFDKVDVLSAGTVAVCEDMIVCMPGSETLNIPEEALDSENALRDTRIIHLHESTGGVLL